MHDLALGYKTLDRKAFYKHRTIPSSSCSNFAIQSYCYRTQFQNAGPLCDLHSLKLLIYLCFRTLCIQRVEVYRISMEFLFVDYAIMALLGILSRAVSSLKFIFEYIRHFQDPPSSRKIGPAPHCHSQSSSDLIS